MSYNLKDIYITIFGAKLLNLVWKLLFLGTCQFSLRLLEVHEITLCFVEIILTISAIRSGVLLLDMNIQFLTAVGIKDTIWTFLNATLPAMSWCMKRLSSLSPSRHATLSFLFSDGILISKKKVKLITK